MSVLNNSRIKRFIGASKRPLIHISMGLSRYYYLSHVLSRHEYIYISMYLSVKYLPRKSTPISHRTTLAPANRHAYLRYQGDTGT